MTLVTAGRVGKPHGLDGSFYVDGPRHGLPEGASLTVAGATHEIERRAGTDERPLIRLAGVGDPGPLRGETLLIEDELAEDEWLAADLAGCRVPGLGTVANVVVIAVAVDLALFLLPPVTGFGPRIALLVGGVVLNGVATAAYVGARLGPGPRDGLMTGVAARTGWSIRLVRTGLEVVVLTVGWLLGGTVGVGTVLYALAIGPLTQAFLPLLTVRDRPAD